MPLSLQHGRIMTPSFQCCWAATIACPQVWIFKEHAQQNENVCPTIWSIEFCWFISATNVCFLSLFYLMASVVFVFLLFLFGQNVSRTRLQQCLPFSWTAMRGKHCRHPIAVMGVVDTFGLQWHGCRLSKRKAVMILRYDRM